jgi:hypothetical protein
MFSTTKDARSLKQAANPHPRHRSICSFPFLSRSRGSLPCMVKRRLWPGDFAPHTPRHVSPDGGLLDVNPSCDVSASLRSDRPRPRLVEGLMHFNVTQYPTQAWLSRQLTEAFPWDTAPRYLPRDWDKSYGPAFRNRVQAMGIEEIVTAPRSPSGPMMILKISRQDAAQVTLGGRSASSLRTSRPMTSEVHQPTRPLRRKGSLHFSTVVTRNGAQEFSFILHHSPPV